jgi:lycopene beta-cyclase
MLFLAADPTRRLQVFQRFYKLPKPLIERFYSGKLTSSDRFRLLAGKPPVPVGRAISAILSSGRESGSEYRSFVKEDQ